jgi:hypothetical protein
MQAVFGEKVIEKLGLHQLALWHDLRHQGGHSAPLQMKGDGIVKLIIGVVSTKIRWVHIDGDTFSKLGL